MIHISIRHLRVELLEERWLPASPVSPVQLHASSHNSVAMTAAPSSASTTDNSANVADPDAGEYKQTAQAANSANNHEPTEDSEYSNSPDSNGRRSANGESPDEYQSSQSSSANARHEDPYFYNGHFYAVVAIPPPPLPGRQSMAAPVAPAVESRTESRTSVIDAASNSVEFAFTSSQELAPNSAVPLGAPDSTPELMPDPPRGDEAQPPTNPVEPPADDPTPGPASAPAVLFDELSVHFNVGEWEVAAKRLFTGLDRVLQNVADPESPFVRMGYWIGTAAVFGVAVELARQFNRARGPRLDLRTSARLSVDK